MKKFEIKLLISKEPTDVQVKKLREYIKEMPFEEVLAGLKFAKNRWSAKDAGVLKVGRKSIIQKEVHSVTVEQAQWRLKNWKMMIANYRRRVTAILQFLELKKSLFKKVVRDLNRRFSSFRKNFFWTACWYFRRYFWYVFFCLSLNYSMGLF